MYLMGREPGRISDGFVIERSEIDLPIGRANEKMTFL